ncbi:hypothetical protein Misp06_04283 [Microbulbifer sp. NBRC 101763]
MIYTFRKYFVFFILLVASSSAISADHFIKGTMNYMASTRTSLLIRLDTGVPANCASPAHNLMKINKEDSVMISVALASWASGKREITVYTDADGSCTIYQLDPQY